MLGRRRWRAALLASTALLAVNTAGAQTVWTGAISSDWFTAGNWIPSAVPDPFETVFLDTVTPNPSVINAAATAGTLILGANASGRLTIDGGGGLNCGSCIIGNTAGASGAITVTGTGSTLTTSGSLAVGNGGEGTLRVTGGGSASSAGATISFNDGPGSAVTVSGVGSTWTITAAVNIGVRGSGLLVIENGATVNGTAATLGTFAGSNGIVVVGGAGSRWTNSADLTVGDGVGSGLLAIDTGGTVFNANGNVGLLAGSTGTVTVRGIDSRWANSDTLAIGAGGKGTLHVSAGGVVSSAVGFVGLKANAIGTVTVSGAGSTWASDSSLTIGAAGGGSLTISDGGKVSNATVGAVGQGGSGTVTVTGAGSAWQNGGVVFIGTFGAGAVTVENGGLVSGTTALVGSGPGASGTVLVTGAGSRWISTASLNVGVNAATGSLSVGNGGSVQNTDGFVGGSDTGTATVSGAGSRWTNTSSLTIAGSSTGSGTGTLSISAGGTVASTQGNIGLVANATGAVAISGAGSNWINSDTLTVGSGGNGSLTIEDGGAVMSTGGRIGERAGSSGSVTVSGAGSGWTNDSNLGVGVGGSAVLAIASGGTVASTGAGVIGDLAGSTGTVTVTGTGSLLATGLGLVIANAGSGTLRVEGGGKTGSLDGIIGNQPGSSGAVTVSGAGSTWTNHAHLVVGHGSTGTLTIADGGIVTSTTGYVGKSAGASGTVTVSGPGSVWNSADLTVGDSGSGVVRIERGGLANTQTGATLGMAAGSTGMMTVTGAGSTWNAGFLEIGRNGNGTLTVENGGRVNSRSANIGVFFGGSVGAVTVRGTGAAWNVDGDLFVSTGGTSTLTVADGGTVRATTTTVASNAGAVGTVNIGAATGQPAAAAGVLDTPTLAFSNGAGTLVFNHTDNAYAFAPTLSGTGTINALAGRTVLTADSGAFSGTTTVNGGVLSVDGKLGGTLAVAAAGRLEGIGAVGTTTIAGTIAPGHSIGTLTVNGNYTQAVGSTYLAEINAAGASDRIAVTGSALLAGGTVLLSGTPGAPGTRYTLLTAAGGVTGTYAALDAASVPSATPFLRYALVYDPAAVFLDVARSPLAFQDAGQTRNQRATGAGLDSLPTGNSIVTALSGLDIAGARAALDQLSGEVHASTRSVLIDDSRFLRDAVTGRLRRAATRPAAGPARVALASRDVAQDATVGRDAGAGGVTAWMQGFGTWGHLGGDGNAARVTRSTGGVVAGADAAIDDTWRLGLAAGYSHGVLNARARSASARIDNIHVALYGGGTWDVGGGTVGLRFGAAYTLHQIDTKRAVTVGGIADHVAAHDKARTAQVFGEAGYTLNVSSAIAIEPVAGLAYVNLDSNRVRETGGITALSGRGGSDSMLFSTLGLRGAATFDVGAMAVTVRGMVGWRHAFGDVTPSARLAFAGSTAFSIAGAPIARNAVVVEAGFDVHIARNVTLGTAYTGQMAKGAQDHGFKATLVWKF